MTVRVGRVVDALASASDGATAALNAWEAQRDRAAFAAYQLPEVLGFVMREAARVLFADYVARHPSRGGLPAWARTLASA